MSCQLIIEGKDFDADKFMQELPASLPKDKNLKLYKGKNITLSIRIGDGGLQAFEQQKAEAASFLEQNSWLFESLKQYSYDKAWLDFGIESRISYYWFCEFNYFPAPLIKLAGQCNLGMSLTLFQPSQRRMKEISREGTRKAKRRKHWPITKS